MNYQKPEIKEKIKKSVLKHDPKKLWRVRFLRWKNHISAKKIADGQFDPSYIYHVEAGRMVSRNLWVEKAIAKALGTTWEKI